MLSLKTIKSAAVIGAGGKMGSGIALVLIGTLALCQNKALVSLIDQNAASLIRLKKYLQQQLKKDAEKQIIALRHLYQERTDLVDNQEIITFHVESALEAVFLSTSLEETQNKDLIFEAASEEIALKVSILKKVAALSPHGIVLTNTSSIPIRFLEEQSGLEKRIAGFHFYNPPFIQKLVEIIAPAPLSETCRLLGKELNKTCVPSKDIAGFIGNGFFMREILFSLNLLKKMDTSYIESVYILDRITKTFLFRPMGIFQLIDYVGIDVAVNILSIMSRFLEDPTFGSDLLKTMQRLGKTGGHHGDSKQKEGFFRYQDGLPDAVFDPELNDYLPIEGTFENKCHSLIGTPLQNVPTWKALSQDINPEYTIGEFYKHFTREDCLGKTLTMTYLHFEKECACLLVKTGVADNVHDISTILKLGFFHLFGPDSPFFRELNFFERENE